MKQEKANKIRLVKILEILRENSDDENYIKSTEIIAILEQMGIACERKTLYDDIAVLEKFGYEILCQKRVGMPNKYCIDECVFDMPELRILMDAVQAASFITPKKTQVLEDKIAKLAGVHKAKRIKNNIMQFNTTKHTNEGIYYSINEIERAIANNKKISFYYFDYNVDKEKVYRENKELYIENPYATIFKDDNYYLIAYSKKHSDMVHYRIDRMEYVKVEEEDFEIPERFKNFDITEHRRQVFGMFGGEEMQVCIEIVPKLINVIMDKFGADVNFRKVANGNVQFSVNIQNSPQFRGWCCSFGDELKIVAPEEMKEKLKEHINLVLKNY